MDIGTDWYLSSDSSAETQGKSLHGDYIVAWDENAMADVVQCNIVEQRKCEFGDKAGERSQLPDRQKNPDGETTYKYGLLETSVDKTPFGTELTPNNRPDPELDLFELRVASTNPGSGWVVYTSGDNRDRYQWVSESCRNDLEDAGVLAKVVGNYQQEIGSLSVAGEWQSCNQLLTQLM